MLDVLNQEYILTARAKGAREPRVVVNHALRNVMIPTLTIIGFSFAYLITGAVLTETIFAWPGVGSYAVSSARSLDYPAIIGVTIVGAAAWASWSVSCGGSGGAGVVHAFVGLGRLGLDGAEAI